MDLSHTAAFADEIRYPLTTRDVIETYGDEQIELPNGTETIGDVIGRIGAETYESPDDLRLALHSALSEKAVGRVGYSDRDPEPPGSVHRSDQVSF